MNDARKNIRSSIKTISSPGNSFKKHCFDFTDKLNQNLQNNIQMSENKPLQQSPLTYPTPTPLPGPGPFVNDVDPNKGQKSNELIEDLKGSVIEKTIGQGVNGILPTGILPQKTMGVNTWLIIIAVIVIGYFLIKKKK